MGVVGAGGVEGGASVDRAGDEVGGVGGWDRDRDGAVGGGGGEAAAVPGGAGEVGVDAAVGGFGVDVAGELGEVEAAVGGLGVDIAVECGEGEGAVEGVEVGGEVAGDVEAVADGPVAAAGGFGAPGLNDGAGFDGDAVEEGVGVGAAGGVGGDAGFEGDVAAVFAEDVDAAVLAADGEATVEEWDGGGAGLAGLVGAAEEVGEEAGVVVAGRVLAGLGGERLGVQAGGGKGEEAEGEGVAAGLHARAIREAAGGGSMLLVWRGAGKKVAPG